MKILEIHVIIKEIIKIIEFQSLILKIKKKKYSNREQQNHENLRMPNDTHGNHENHRIPLENQ